jgi:hypothetical protein
MKISIEHWWNVTDTGKPKYSEKNRSYFHFVHQKAYTDHLHVSAVWRLKGIYFVYKDPGAIS